MSEATNEPAPEVPGSKPLRLPRMELFAQEVTAGRTKSDAYIEAYPKAADWKASAVHVKASMLAAREDVKARLAFLQQKAADASVFTLAAHLARLNALSIDAQRQGEFSSAVTAEISRGKAAGFYPTKVELTGRGGGPIETKQTRDMTPQELQEALKAYGIEP